MNSELRHVSAACLLLAGCAYLPPPAPGHVLPTVTFEIGDRLLLAEVAATFEDRGRGLMYRESLEDNRGMLFVYPGPESREFWMAKTRIPLTLAYLADDGTILEIHDLTPLDETGVPSAQPVRYALEVNRGWFARAGLRPGDRLPGFEDATRGLSAK